ncbi:ribosomal protein S6 kinase delta-1 isoform X12 [Gorilla gorilla gorilla]|uniref:ribosomal protein S6 kinase delta-1 isoform X10 n=1 Tax=Pan troglodytes TaxID=9598 RepID=UPI0023F3FA3A|nr:ribosomal protein S6 kinase delta-1 isoform X9 [Pan troglodytes]XP_055227315.1 ribosomal protein S6 kinase delta-1 isoform X8 [Gorilla gorilla gorilla]
MTSYRERSADLARFYTVTEPQRHPRGYTVYKVTARVVSRRNPEDVQEIIVWKRYSDFKKLHKELWQIHKNLFRHSELFPPFAKGIVFGRFDETVIEERRQCAEDLLQFSANIPALYNSKQLEDFFKGGIINDSSELIGPAEAHSDSLIDTFPECSTEGESSPTRREAVKRRTAEYLMRAESISSLYGKPQLDDVSQVLLVMDTRTEQTFILKGLRKSSEYSRNRKTIIPRCVPNMVCLHKYIISEESVFLVLQHAEGGKLWSYISKFLNRSPEESFDIKEVKKPTLAKVHLQQPTSSPQDSSSFESRGSDGGSMLKALPLKSSLTPSSQDDSNQEDDGQDSSPKWPDSGSSSEEECTTSYLTLCNEYGQEKIEPGSLNEEPFMKTEGNGVDTKAIKSFPAHLAADSDSPSTQLRAHELKFFPNDDPEAVSSPRTSDSLSRSKNSPMEFFRIDSKDSASELLGLDFGEKLYSLKSEPLKPFFTLPDGDSASRSFNTSESKVEFKAQDTISRGSDDSVPVISFKDAAFDDVSGTDEGRPDLLVNLPGELESTREAAAMGPTKFTQTNIGIIENKLLEAPDVLCLRLSTEQCQAHEEKGIEELSDPSGPKSYSITEKHYAQEDPRMLFVAAVDHSSSGDMSLLPSSDPKFQGLGVVESAVTANNTEESLFRICSPLSGANEYIASTDTLKTEEVLLFTDQTDDLAKEEPTSLFQRDSETKGESGLVLEGDKEIHQIFEDLDKKLALTSRFYIPEGCIQRWAAEMVVALDALHREGIVCRDLNPNNILLNDRGHIQLTYFSRWSEVEDSCDSDAIERMYCAPEVGAITEETEACDWWSLGAVLFELLTGKTLVECHPAGINTHTTLNMPECVSEEARSLIQQLLQFNPLERLGAGVAGVEDIKSHPFFTPVDWAELMR